MLFIKTWLSFVLDFVWWLVFVFSFFSFLLVFSEGSMRSVYLLASFVGFFAFYLTLGVFTKNLWLKMMPAIRRKCRKIRKKIHSIYKKVKKVLQLPWQVLYNKRSIRKKAKMAAKAEKKKKSKKPEKNKNKRRVKKHEKKNQRTTEGEQAF